MAAPALSIEDVLRSTLVLSTAAPATIDRLGAASTLRTYERDETLFLCGSRSTSIVIVVSGILRVFTSTSAGTEPTLALIHVGQVVGEVGVLDHRPRSASIGALRRTTVVEVSGRAFRAAYDSDPAISRQMVAMLADRVRVVSDGLADLVYLDLGGRLAKYLVSESERQRSDTLRLPLTQAELGQLLGGARQTVNQVAQGLERAGLVELVGRTVRIVDEPGLRLRASSRADRRD